MGWGSSTSSSISRREEKTPKRRVARAPKVEVSRELHARDVAVKSEWRMNGCDDEWEIPRPPVRRAQLVWKGTPTADDR